MYEKKQEGVGSGSVKVFLSYRFTKDPKIKNIISVFKTIAHRYQINLITAENPDTANISQKVKTLINESDCAIFLLTPSDYSNNTTSAWINQEYGYAKGLGLKTIVFADENIKDYGMIKFDTEIISLNYDDIQKVVDAIMNFFSECKNRYIVNKTSMLHKTPENLSDLNEYIANFDSRLYTNIAVKERIADFVSDIVLSSNNIGTTGIFLDSGSLTYIIASKLVDKGFSEAIITNNLELARDFSNYSFMPIYLILGKVDPLSRSIGGEESLEFLKEIFYKEPFGKFNWIIVSASTFGVKYGIGADSELSAIFKRNLLKLSIEFKKKILIVFQGEKCIKLRGGHHVMRLNDLIGRGSTGYQVRFITHKLSQNKTYPRPWYTFFDKCVKNMIKAGADITVLHPPFFAE